MEMSESSHENASLRIGSLPPEITDDDLNAHFSAFAMFISKVKVARDDTHRDKSKRFGFVYFTDAAIASQAKKELDGTDMMGQRIQVCFSRSEREQTIRGSLWVGSLHFLANKADLLNHFSEFSASIVNVRIMVDKGTHKSKGVGYVNFRTKKAAISARDLLNGSILKGRPIKLRLNDSPSKKPVQPTASSSQMTESPATQKFVLGGHHAKSHKAVTYGVKISGLPLGVKNFEIRQMAALYGTVAIVYPIATETANHAFIN
eukprot:m.161185 g.161185  ORF g.161185 m.161185 type:complete len:261 (+) comp38804_c0_seq2:182-964(+)